jgi:sodium transport system permease protein
MKAITVFLKEVKETVRDRRTMLSALLYGPLLGPAMLLLIATTTMSHQLEQADQPLKVAVIGAGHAPHLLDALKQQGLVAKPPVADPEAAVRRQDADVVLRIPDGYEKAWNHGEPTQVELVYDSSRRDSQDKEQRLASMVHAYARKQGAMRMMARGLPPTLMTPVAVAERDQSTPQSRAGLVFGMLPYFFMFTLLMGGMYLAIDLSAGERERQSLEPLFANPLPRWQILLGKLGAIWMFSLGSLLICLVAFGVVGRFMPTDKMGMSLNVGWSFCIQTLLMMLPMVLLLGSLQTLVAAFAKTYREAQTYMTVLMLLAIMPSLMLSFMPVKIASWMYAVPLLAQQVGITRVLRGDPVAASDIALCLASGLVAAVLMVAATAWTYRSERLAISA